MRHRAWLDAAPQPKKGPRSNVTRLALAMSDVKKGRERPELEMPPVDAAFHLVDYLFEVGPALAGETLSFQEIEAWRALAGYRINSWEALMLKRLSSAYMGEYSLASDPARAAPFRTQRQIDRKAISDRIKASFEQYMAAEAKTAPKTA